MVQSQMIQETLCAEGHDVFLSQDGEGILDIMTDKGIGIVLLDIVLPTYDGFELLDRILRYDYTSEIPVIMVTGLTSGHDVKRALDMGAFDYIKKPIDPVELVARVNAACRLKAKQELLREFAITDKLTNLYNRAYFDEMLAKVVADISSSEKGITLAMLDCDYFKSINDTYGHIAGDRVLASVANALYKSVKGTDIVCRYGGEEFCMILTNTTLQEGFRICERVRGNVEKLRVKFDDMIVSLAISIGATHLAPDESVSALSLIDEADQALYMAKIGGRNRVEVLTRPSRQHGGKISR